VLVGAAADPRDDGISRPPNAVPVARPTTSANTIAAVLLMPFLRACGLYF
jgi:hypothetical protein